MKGWNEVKTVLTVMKYGTLSGAAKQLGVHRATVLRHVDTLESELKTKLFVRHANGYLPTDTGRELERIAKVTEDQFDLFSKRIRYNNSELEGDFVITSLDILCPLLMPAIRIFQEKHPKVMVNFQSSEDIFKLEYGQAHVAIRTGSKPTEDDYVCIPFADFSIGLYAHDSYIEKHGVPKTVEDFHNHYFVSNTSDSEKRKKLIKIISHDVERIERLITDYSQMLKDEASLSRAKMIKINLLNVIDSVVEDFNSNLLNSNKNIKININNSNLNGSNLNVLGVESKLEQIVANLLDNAVSFSPPNSKISVICNIKKKDAQLIIEDEGPGFNEKNIDKVFNRFYSNRPEKFGEHSGLGLNIVKNIIELHGGSIVVSNQNGNKKGARIEVLLPMCK
mgnify:CR=1 FL=1